MIKYIFLYFFKLRIKYGENSRKVHNMSRHFSEILSISYIRTKKGQMLNIQRCQMEKFGKKSYTFLLYTYYFLYSLSSFSMNKPSCFNKLEG